MFGAVGRLRDPALLGQHPALHAEFALSHRIDAPANSKCQMNLYADDMSYGRVHDQSFAQFLVECSLGPDMISTMLISIHTVP